MGLKLIYRQIIKFLLVSGTGWLIDFGLYSILASIFGLNVLISNLISTIPAFTFVFFISARHIFKTNVRLFSVKQKYIFYFSYQILLVIIISFFGQWSYNFLLPALTNNGINPVMSKFIIKILITPITILVNFTVMKLLTEKL